MIKLYNQTIKQSNNQSIKMSDIMKTSVLQFHTKKDGFFYEGRNSVNHFGVFFLELNETPILTQRQFVCSMNDMSGSMSDFCDDGSTKIQHLHATLENIVILFSEKSAQITMEITGFDDKITEVLMPTEIRHNDDDADDNEEKAGHQVTQICQKIKEILKPRNSTDIGLALKHAKSRIENIESLLQASFSEKHLIFMTDGNITKGVMNYAKLQSQISKDSRNYFIGFGDDHDYQLLQTLAQTHSDAYYYVDKIENAGLVFGEIIHSILYTALKNITITAENGEIYDFVINKWTNQIVVPYLCGEAKKQYHVRSPTPELCQISYTACEVPTGNIYMSSETVIPNLEYEDGTIVETDLRKYMYRQVTLELLSQAVELVQKYDGDVPYKEEANMREKIHDFRKNLQLFADEYTDESDKLFMKQLCDDLYICEKTIHSKTALLYTNVRKTSQGSGGSYNITKINEYELYNVYDISGDDYEISQDTMNLNNTSTTQCQIMRQCSQR